MTQYDQMLGDLKDSQGKGMKDKKTQVTVYIGPEEESILEDLIICYSTEHWKPSKSEMIKIALRELNHIRRILESHE